MHRSLLTASLLCAVVLAARGLAQTPDPPPRVTALVRQARAMHDEGDLAGARGAVARALERDPNHLDALLLSAELAGAAGDLDRAVHDRHRWLELHDARDRRLQDRRQRKVVEEALLELDPEAGTWARLQERYVRGLIAVAKRYERREDLLGALDLWSHVLQVEPTNERAPAAIARIRRSGGAEVAVEDLYAGAGDPTAGMSATELAEADARHADWEHAYTKETENYRYRTNAGRLVLETSAIAMEQMNRFYRRFFRFKEDGGNTPQIEIRIFKSRDEYLELGQNPAPWSGGHFIGSAVETYVGGVSGKEGVRGMYRTLFHEAAHQFVSLSRPFVPGWLNEAYASYFEGCTILSNGTVRWNQVPPGRLFPLATRMEAGWMHSVDEARTDADGDWVTPDTAPRFRTVVEGAYRWGPPWYAPTWGVVYFLHNYRDDQGRTVWRDALQTYAQSFRRGRPTEPAVHFEEEVLSAPLSPVRRIDELDPVWKEWILDLRDRFTGRKKDGSRLLQWADAALERDEPELALEFLLEARDELGPEPDLLWRTAALLEDLDRDARAAASYREFRRELELSGASETDERYAQAGRRVERLDPLTRRYRSLKEEIAADGLALARSYEERGLVTMALDIARRMSANYSIPSALEYYVALAERTGRSLARWRVAYDERSLRGWSGDREAYQAYGALIRADVAADADDPERMLTRQLVCDMPFDADFSLEAQVRIPASADGDGFEGRLAGLCFGRQGDQEYHAVMLFPDGYLDVATNRGGVWEVRDHRSVPAGGGSWHTLRIDVTGATLDVYLDDLYVRALEFPSPNVIRGGFGLLTGPGRAEYREIRVLARDPHDPAARIERRLAMQKVLADASLRQEGSFSGIAPPALAVRWHRGEPTTLAELRGGPTMLVFWTPAQERVIPTARYLTSLLERGRDAELRTVVIADAGTTPAALDAALAEWPLPGARIAIDAAQGTTYDRYFVKPGHHGLPRVLLLDADGRVVFEGDPGLQSGAGWQPGDARTYVDDPFDALIGAGGG